MGAWRGPVLGGIIGTLVYGVLLVITTDASTGGVIARVAFFAVWMTLFFRYVLPRYLRRRETRSAPAPD